MNVDGVIVRVTPYKESGAMINVLTETKLLSFYAREIYKVNSKNVLLTSPLMYAKFTFSDKGDVLTFKEMYPILDTRNFMGDYYKLAAVDFLNEVTIRLFNENEMPRVYPFLTAVLKTIVNTKKINTLLITYLAICLNMNGFGLYVDGCVISKSKNNIVGISYNDGGFVCKEVYRSTRHKLYSPNKINLIRAIFKIKDANNLNRFSFNDTDVNEVFNDLLIYTYDQTGIRFKSEKLLKK